jgi:hypothetical protein
MRSDVEGWLQHAFAALGQTADFNLVGSMDQAFHLKETFAEGASLYALKILLETALNLALERSQFCATTGRTAAEWALVDIAATDCGEMCESAFWAGVGAALDWAKLTVFGGQLFLHRHWFFLQLRYFLLKSHDLFVFLFLDGLDLQQLLRRDALEGVGVLSRSSATFCIALLWLLGCGNVHGGVPLGLGFFDF